MYFILKNIIIIIIIGSFKLEIFIILLIHI